MPRRRRSRCGRCCPLAVVALVVLPLALVGCGDPELGQDQGDRVDLASIRSVFVRFADAINTGDFQTACDLYTERAQQLIIDAGNHFGRGPTTTACPEAFGRIAGRLSKQSHQLANVVVTGNRASAINVNARSNRRVLFERVDGVWRVDNATRRSER
jgi:ketosteroid isomerase-like protein